jgi:hypothetical protein
MKLNNESPNVLSYSQFKNPIDNKDAIKLTTDLLVKRNRVDSPESILINTKHQKTSSQGIVIKNQDKVIK